MAYDFAPYWLLAHLQIALIYAIPIWLGSKTALNLKGSVHSVLQWGDALFRDSASDQRVARSVREGRVQGFLALCEYVPYIAAALWSLHMMSKEDGGILHVRDDASAQQFISSSRLPCFFLTVVATWLVTSVTQVPHSLIEFLVLCIGISGILQLVLCPLECRHIIKFSMRSYQRFIIGAGTGLTTRRVAVFLTILHVIVPPLRYQVAYSIAGPVERKASDAPVDFFLEHSLIRLAILAAIISRDMVLRKEISAKLALQTLLDAASQGFCTVDRSSGTLLTVSPQLQSTLGVSASPGKNLKNWGDGDKDQDTLSALTSGPLVEQSLRPALVTCSVSHTDTQMQSYMLDVKIIPYAACQGEVSLCVQSLGESRHYIHREEKKVHTMVCLEEGRTDEVSSLLHDDATSCARDILDADSLQYSLSTVSRKAVAEAFTQTDDALKETDYYHAAVQTSDKGRPPAPYARGCTSDASSHRSRPCHSSRDADLVRSCDNKQMFGNFQKAPRDGAPGDLGKIEEVGSVRIQHQVSQGIQTESKTSVAHPRTGSRLRACRPPRPSAHIEPAVKLNTSRRVHRQFKITPTWTWMELIRDLMWKVNACGSGCCKMHVILHVLQRHIQDFNSKPCEPNAFRGLSTSSHMQCPECFAIGERWDSDDESDASHETCDICLGQVPIVHHQFSASSAELADIDSGGAGNSKTDL